MFYLYFDTIFNINMHTYILQQNTCIHLNKNNIKT